MTTLAKMITEVINKNKNKIIENWDNKEYFKTLLELENKEQLLFGISIFENIELSLNLNDERVYFEIDSKYKSIKAVMKHRERLIKQLTNGFIKDLNNERKILNDIALYIS